MKNKDLSWMWHCSSNNENIINYSALDIDANMAKALNKAVAIGFRLALRKMEKLNLIEMQDIDRSANNSDQETWNNTFKDEE